MIGLLPMPESRPALVTLMALDPIVHTSVESQSPCGDPMGIEYNPVSTRLSAWVEEYGWASAMKLREVRRLVAALEDA